MSAVGGTTFGLLFGLATFWSWSLWQRVSLFALAVLAVLISNQLLKSLKGTKMNDNKPLVLLDVDGVINDLRSLSRFQVDHSILVFRSEEYMIHMPRDLPDLVQHLVAVAEVHWCTTWREKANGEIARHLGIDPLPVITNRRGERHAEWKPAAALPLVREALASGREVFWIEDFDGGFPTGPVWEKVHFIDTALSGWRLDSRLLDGTVLEWTGSVQGAAR